MGIARHLALSALVLAGAAVAAEAPCGAGSAAGSEGVRTVRRDLGEVFSFLEKKGGGAKAPPAPVTPAADRLIVPAVRAGAFEIGAARAGVTARVRLGDCKTRTDPRYEYLLPLEYLPPRRFCLAAGERVTLAFLPEALTLAEIFVRDPEYATAEGIRVGTPAGTVSSRAGVRSRNGPEGRVYFLEEGITYIAGRGAVEEIVVRRGQAGE